MWHDVMMIFGVWGLDLGQNLGKIRRLKGQNHTDEGPPLSKVSFPPPPVGLQQHTTPIAGRTPLPSRL